MKQRNIVILAVLLAAQLILALVLGLRGAGTAPTPDRPLLALEATAVDRIAIAAPDRETVLVRDDDGWRLAGDPEIPADGAKVEALVERLSGLRKGWPVATTEGALERFQVADEAFERKIVLSQGDTALATLYLGTSPGLRRLHVRPADERAVYSVPLAQYEVSVKPEDWEDKALLVRPAEDIVRVELADGTALVRTDDGYTLQGVPAGAEVDRQAAEALVNDLAGARIERMLGDKPDPAYGLERPDWQVGLATKQGAKVEYRFGKPQGANHYILKSSDRPYYFRVAAYVVEDLKRNGTRAALTVDEPGTGATAEGPGGAETGQDAPPVEQAAPAAPTSPEAEPAPTPAD